MQVLCCQEIDTHQVVSTLVGLVWKSSSSGHGDALIEPIPIPEDVNRLVHRIFADCNQRVSAKLGRIPNIHETSLDHTFIEHFTHHCRPVQTESNWTTRFDCHFIGGGSHYDRWEVADLAVLVVFRNKGVVFRSKVVLFQAKRLYPDEGTNIETNALNERLGFNDMFLSDQRWHELSQPRTFTFSDRSMYRALEVADRQYTAIEDYEKRHKIPVHYLFYNPPQIPSTTQFPIVVPPENGYASCEVGCRVVSSALLRRMIHKQVIEHPPRYSDLREHLGAPYDSSGATGGWRLESYIVEQLLACKDGLVDTTPKYEHLNHIFSYKQRPISAAITITCDIP